MANRARLEQAVEAFNRHDEGYFDLYTDGVAMHGLPGTEGTLDKQGVIEFYRAFWAAFPDATVEPEDMFSADDRVAVRLRVKGTHRGELMGVAASGNKVDVEQITIFKLDDEGRCLERWVRLDEIAFLQQIGAMPTPAASA
jgi:steroid delta-isomerase-like uncharacterized protein